MCESEKIAIDSPGESPFGGLSLPGRFGRLSVITLVVSNLIPLFGVIFAGWRVFPIMLLFSLENIIIGFYNVLRMGIASCDLEEIERTGKGIHGNLGLVGKCGLIIFFCIHYGGFVFGHLLFVVLIFGSAFSSGGELPAELTTPASWEDVAALGESMIASWWGFCAALIACFISHGVSYVKNFIGSGEYKRVTVIELMARPYGRMAVMHVTIIFGAFLVILTGTHVATVVLLVVLKSILDLAGHLYERKKFRKHTQGKIPG